MQWFDVDVTMGKQKQVVRLLAHTRAGATQIVRSWGNGRKVTGARLTPTQIARRLTRLGFTFGQQHIASIDGKDLRWP
jgi:hypothetical protein